MSQKKRSIVETHPYLVDEWHPIKNGSQVPTDFTSGANTKVWWKCFKGPDHEWESTIANRRRGRGCPYCNGKKVSSSNSLYTLGSEELLREWHPTKNRSFSPRDVSAGSNMKVWWKCSKDDDHEWKSSISSRSLGRGCPVCSGRKVVKSNCLQTSNPQVAQQWHPFKNGNLNPTDVTEGTNIKVWWKCPEGEDHEWKSLISSRGQGKGCPYCQGKRASISNSLHALGSEEIIREWHPTKNETLSPKDVTLSSGVKVWWKCSKDNDHIWMASVGNRTQLNSGCPFCSGHKVDKSNCLTTTHPLIAKEWHYLKNGNNRPEHFNSGSNKTMWWKCPEGDDHIWNSSIKNRIKVDCPICYGRRIVPSNCLATTHPEVATQWYASRNSPLTPEDIGYGSKKSVWWKCIKGEDHIWKGSIGSRTKSKGATKCPICTGRITVQSNSLSVSHPKIAIEWHPLLNSYLTPSEVGFGSSKVVWWKCSLGDDHIWKSSINSRTSQNSGCPICDGKKVVESTCLRTTHPHIAATWNYDKNGTLSPREVSHGSKKVVWWKCDKDVNHEWRTSIGSRTNRGCPFCTLTPQSKQELTITFELMSLFNGIDPKGFKTIVGGKLKAIDIYITSLNLCIEFDGSYWHKGKRELDKIKSEMLLKDGYQVIRIREEPLEKIHDTDVIGKKPYSGKQVTNDILSMILKMYDLDGKLINHIKIYQSKSELQNEKGLDRYIEKILKEKANK